MNRSQGSQLSGQDYGPVWELARNRGWHDPPGISVVIAAQCTSFRKKSIMILFGQRAPVGVAEACVYRTERGSAGSLSQPGLLRLAIEGREFNQLLG